MQAIAGALIARHGLKRGDRVALAMENCPEYFPLLYGIWRAGLSAVPMNSKLHAKEMAWILADSAEPAVHRQPEARRCAFRAGPRHRCRRSSPPAPPTIARCSAGDAVQGEPGDANAEAWLFYTSGTTGRPKGAMLTHRNLLFACHCYYADIDYIDTRDTILHAAPLTHGSGLYGLAHIARGAHNVILEGSFEPERVFAALGTYDNCAMFAAPTMVSRLINDPRAGSADTRGLKTIIYGGAPMYLSDLKRALELFGPKLYNLYGQGESPMTITGLDKAMHAEFAQPGRDDRLASAGIARTGVAVKVVGEDGRELPHGEVGEIVTAQRLRDAGLLEQPGGQRQGAARRLAVDRRPGLHGRRRLRHHQGPLQGHDHLGRLQHLSARDRGGAADAPGRAGGGGGRPPARRVGRGGGGLRGGAPWRQRVGRADLDRLCLDNIARFKRPKGYRFVDGAAQEQLRQDPEDRAARAAGGGVRGLALLGCHVIQMITSAPARSPRRRGP